MNKYFVIVRYSENSVGFGNVYLHADNCFQAFAMAQAMYGSLLISTFATQVPN